MLNGTRLGNAIVDRLKAEGLIDTGREVHHFDVGSVGVGTNLAAIFVGPDNAWTHSVTITAESANPSLIASQLAGAITADPIVSPYFDAVATAARVTTTTKAGGQTFGYSVAGVVQHSAGAPVEADEDVREFWGFIGEEIVAEIQAHAEVTTAVTGTASTDGIALDLDPTDGVRDGELLEDAAITGTGTGTVG